MGASLTKIKAPFWERTEPISRNQYSSTTHKVPQHNNTHQPDTPHCQIRVHPAPRNKLHLLYFKPGKLSNIKGLREPSRAPRRKQPPRHALTYEKHVQQHKNQRDRQVGDRRRQQTVVIRDHQRTPIGVHWVRLVLKRAQPLGHQTAQHSIHHNNKKHSRQTLSWIMCLLSRLNKTHAAVLVHVPPAIAFPTLSKCFSQVHNVRTLEANSV
mmetsp:Transcript_20784/g.34375  ORF Transcript_20784/g.34375 Transcript_20784/m.34375 type:complete len:211 (-) Transcript_20784:82-714(-)